MTDNKSTSKHGYLLAFVVGMLLMLVMYVLFESTARRARRLELGELADTEAGRTDSGAFYTSIVQTGGEQETPSLSAFLGVEIVSVDAVIAKQLEVPGGTGALVNSVVGGSPAEMAGLERGDVIVTLDNSGVKDLDGFREIIARLDPDDTVRIVFVRDGGKDVAYAQLAEAPAVASAAETQGPGESGWGVSLSPITPPLRETLGIPGDVKGVVILSVAPGGAADGAGLMPADVIRGVDNTPVSDIAEFFKAISSDRDDTALLDVYAQGGSRYVPMDSSAVKVADETQTQQTLRQRILAIFTGGAPFTDDEEEEDGPKGGKFAQEPVELTADTTGFARPSTVPGDANTGGPSSSGGTGFSRPSTVPGETNTGGPGASPNDIVLFVGLLLVALVYLAYREYNRPPELDRD